MSTLSQTQRVVRICPQVGEAGDRVVLDFDRRKRRRIVHQTEQGRSILLDAGKVVHLRDGDGLELDDGTMVRVEAALEPLAAITAADLPALVRIAWHLGNRHLPTQLEDGRLLIARDHVIEAMVHGLGGTCRHVDAAFDPEGGAYEGGGHEHAHHHSGHDHGH